MTPDTAQLFTWRKAQAFAEAFARWRRLTEIAERHPGTVTPEDLATAWDEALDLFAAWQVAE